jgi:hypothetical protein
METTVPVWEQAKQIDQLNAYYEHHLHGVEAPCIKLDPAKVVSLCSELGLLQRLETDEPSLLQQLRIYDMRQVDGKYWVFLSAEENPPGSSLFRWVKANARTPDDETFASCLAHIMRRMERIKNGLPVD